MSSQQSKPITILGAGSWGTAIALSIARRGITVRLWSCEIKEIAALLAERTNNQFLPGFAFPDTIEPTANLSEAVENIDDIIIAVPSVGYRETLTMLKPLLYPNIRITSATKGLDEDTGQLLDEVVKEVLGPEIKFAAMSGPTFAREVAQGLPSAAVLASEDETLRKEMAATLDSPIFRITQSSDVKGVEIGGVAKNVIAIATGIVDGLELGTNARSALITQGLDEITRLGVSLGADKETFYGLSGLGDLILTCSDNQSRNRRFGLALGKEGNVEEAERSIGQVVEGKRNAELILKLAKTNKIDMPICETVLSILEKKLSAHEAFEKLFSGSNNNKMTV